MQVLALLAALVGLPQHVHVVHPTLGPFVQVRDAVQAAADGDVVLVAPGNYLHFGVIGKGLSILPSSAAGAINVFGTVRVQAVPAGSTVTLKGLRLNGSHLGDPALRCASNLGAVRIEACTVTSSLTDDAVLSDCEDVSLIDFVSNGNGVGLVALDSNISLFGGRYLGRSFAGHPWGPSGWPGISVTRCHLCASGVYARGGDGGDEETWIYTCLAPPGPGGPAIAAEDSVVEVLDATLIVGYWGLGLSGYCTGTSLPPVPPVSTAGTTTVTWDAGEALELSVTALGHVGSGGALDVTMLGEPGAASVLLVAPRAARVEVPGIAGALLIGGATGSVRRLSLGPAPVSRSLPAPLLPHPFDIESFHCQALQLQSAGVVLGPPRSIAVLGAGW